MSRFLPSPAPFSSLRLPLLALGFALLALLSSDSALAQDASGPQITSGPTIASSPESGDTYRSGETITVAVTFSGPVVVTGEPRLRLQVGEERRWAGYESAGEDGATLSFSYVVTADDRDDDGVSLKKNAIDPNDGKIEDADGNRARVRHGQVDDQPGHKVDGSLDESTPAPEPEPANNEPQFADDTAARSIDENTVAGENVGAAVTADDGDGDTLTYALTGADAGAFDLDASTGQISVKDALDYEAKASYAVTVTVHDGKNAAGDADTNVDDTIAVTITVLNVDEAGIVSLVTENDAPTAGSEISATLLDPDGGVTGLAWDWERSADGNAWTAITGATAAAYTPANDDVDHYLRATASYDDGEGTGKTAMAATAGTVAAAVVDEPPSVTGGPILNAPQSGDTYGVGEEIIVSLTFSEAVTVSGNPRIGVIIGENRRWARYSESRSGGATLVFAYEVKAADRDDDGINIRKNALRRNGGSIQDGGGNAAVLEHPAVAALVSHKVDGSASPFPGEPQTAQTVAADWALIPKDSMNNPHFTAGQSFRLLFITSTKRNAQSSNIADYNTHVQNAANTNNTLKPFKGEFRVVGSTDSVNAIDNTATTFTDEDGKRGVPIYWVGGAKVADHYKDFYDGSWASYQARNESGTVSNDDTYFTGTANNGRARAPFFNRKKSLGGTGLGGVDFGDLRQQNTLDSGNAGRGKGQTMPFLALSPVITVQAASAKPKVTLVLGATSIAESGSSNATTIKATLAAAAAAETLSALPAGVVTLGASTLTIASGATESPTTTVTAVDNKIDASNASVTISGTVSPTSVAAPDAVTLTVSDDDTRGVTVDPTSLAVTEASGAGNTATYMVKLNSQPLADVMVTPSSNDTTSVTVSGALTFTSSDWSTAQTVTVTAVSDSDMDNESVTISHAVSGAGSGYVGVTAASVSVNVTDDDEPQAPAKLRGFVASYGVGAVSLSWYDPGDSSITKEPLNNQLWSWAELIVGVFGDVEPSGGA